jgi:hypothetical protein
VGCHLGQKVVWNGGLAVTYIARIPGIPEIDPRDGRTWVGQPRESQYVARLGAQPARPQDLVGMSMVLRMLAHRPSAFDGLNALAHTLENAQPVSSRPTS